MQLQDKSVLITQSNYIPWKGYFDSIALVDVFVVYDEMQFTRRDWRNRNQIYTDQGLKWLTIPVEISGKFDQKIKDTKIADSNWTRIHWETIRHNYGKCAGFKEVGPWLEELYLKCNFTFLSEVNLHFIRAINSFFEIKTEILSSSDFELVADRNQRLVNICHVVGANTYYSGPAAKAYVDAALFEKENIDLLFLDYSDYKEYPQQNKPFTHAVSVIDLLCNAGNQSAQYLKYRP